MIYLLYGVDQYQILGKVKTLKNRFAKSKNGSLNIATLDNHNFNIEKTIEALTSKPFFGKKKLVILRDVLKKIKKVDEVRINKILKNKKIPKETNVIFWEESIDQRREIFKTLKKTSAIFEAKALNQVQVRQFVKKVCKKNGFSISDQAFQKLSVGLINDLFAIENELNKLITYKDLEKEINEKDVDLLTEPETSESVFEFIENIARKEKTKALVFFSQEILKGKGAPYLVSMISYQFKNMIIIKSLMEKNFNFQEIKRKTKLHPFVIEKTQKLLPLFTFQELKKIYKNILVLDLEVKSTGKTENAFEKFVLTV